MPRENRRLKHGAPIAPSRAFFRAAGLVLGTVLAVFVRAVARVTAPTAAARIPMAWHRMCCLLIGLDVRRYGQPAETGPVLYICNHASYLDVPVMGASVRASFVAKAEVASWPVIGALSRLQDTVFVDRRPHYTHAQRCALQRHLRAGRSLILFPEGTSGDGNRVLPFKTGLFSAADLTVQGRPVTVQPVTVAYSRLDGWALGRALRPYFAWYGDMTLVDHLWTCLGFKRPGIDVVFHEAVQLGDFGSRKDLARHCETVIAEGLSNALSGRLDDLYGDDLSDDRRDSRDRDAGWAQLPEWPAFTGA